MPKSTNAKKPLLARIGNLLNLNGAQSINSFPYEGREAFHGNLLVNEGGTDYIDASGYAQADGANNTAVLLKFDTGGVPQWRSVKSEGAGGRDAVLLQIDPATGDVVSSTLWGGTDDEIARGITADGTRLYVVGESNSVPAATRSLSVET
jgi:hypothetical protein